VSVEGVTLQVRKQQQQGAASGRNTKLPDGVDRACGLNGVLQVAV